MGGLGAEPMISNNTGFLDKNMNDPSVLRKMIAELEAENKKLKAEQEFSSSKTLST